MSQTPRDLAPSGIALRLQQRSDVVEHDRVTVRAIAFARQLGARAHQHTPPAFGPQHDLLAPFAISALQVPLRDADELFEQRLALRELHDRFTHVSFEVHAENRARGMIRSAYSEVRLQRHDARRHASENHLELTALALDLLLARARFLA